MLRRIFGFSCVLFLFFTAGQRTSAADWPMYRADASRSGYTAEALPERLKPAWKHEAAAPMPAWPTRERLRFDAACQPVVSGGLVFYGSSPDGKVYALDAATGRLRWEFFTDGPVRFAPAVWRDRLFVASDDGYLYCLAADDGRLVWKRRGGPRADMLLGNDRMVSRWPARGGPVVLDDTVYFAAGIWPSEGVYVYALDPETGNVRWCNDTAGGLELDQPHKTARAKSGIAAQGYLVAAGERLLVPTGRGVPAALDRASGEFLYCELQPNTHLGGADAVAIDDWFHNGGAIFDGADETVMARTGLVVAAAPEMVLISGKAASLSAMARESLITTRPAVDRKGAKTSAQGLGAAAVDRRSAGGGHAAAAAAQGRGTA